MFLKNYFKRTYNITQKSITTKASSPRTVKLIEKCDDIIDAREYSKTHQSIQKLIEEQHDTIEQASSRKIKSVETKKILKRIVNFQVQVS
jgi:hypothetical protein